MELNFGKMLFATFICLLPVALVFFLVGCISKKQSYVPQFEDNGIKTFLFWNNFFGENFWMLPNKTNKFQCPMGVCVFTTERKYLPSISLYDAIIFHVRNFPYNYSMRWQHKKRHPRQQYIFALMEPPHYIFHSLENEANFYNWTMTFQLDSDIVWSYNQVVDIETNGIVAPSAITHWRKVNTEWTQTDGRMMNWIKKKTKLIAWFVSNCHTPSRREDFVNQMRELVDIDIYGECGDKICKKRSEECNDLIDNNYKFYLSFENSMCKDYVTEKLYFGLLRNVIPVVYGGANYSLFAPPHSYINVFSYDNVTALVNYLKYLDKTPKEYAKYFWWRKYYKINHNSLIPLLPICDLCNRINSKQIQHRTQIYRNIREIMLESDCVNFPNYNKTN